MEEKESPKKEKETREGEEEKKQACVDAENKDKSL